MNDRLKFRVYVFELKRYLTSKEIVVGLIDCLRNPKVIPDGIECWGLEIDPKYGIIEQCTGLKDRSGKLIFEGDILSGSNGSINGVEWPFQSTVTYSLTDAKFTMPVWAYDENGNYHENRTHYVEIIGNIHESEAPNESQ